MKKNKENEKGHIFITIILAIFPIIYFAMATTFTLDLFTIKLHTDLGYETEEILKMHDAFYDALKYNGICIAIYALFLFLLYLNVKLYKESKKTILIILNIGVLLAAIVSYFALHNTMYIPPFAPILFMIFSVISLILSFTLKGNN